MIEVLPTKVFTSHGKNDSRLRACAYRYWARGLSEAFSFKASLPAQQLTFGALIAYDLFHCT